jgi:hypothetical protein
MQQFPDEAPRICWSCKENEATESFTYAGRPTRVCARCREWLEARDELEHLLRNNMDLEDRGQIDEALRRLDAFMAAKQHCDHDFRFARQVSHHRAMTLFDAERYAEAEQACAAWAQLGFAKDWERWEHGYETAQTLDALGRPREALSVLEDALSHQDTFFIGAAEKLVALVDLSDKLGQPVDQKWQSLAEVVAKAYGVEIPSRGSLGETFRALAEMIRDMLPLCARDGYQEPTHE